ncbi:MAG: PilZ domain-containing protein [Spirochaetota bacterium]
MSGYQIDRRENDRIDCADDYFLSPKEKGVKVRCILNNISVTGACIRTDYPIEPDEYLTLHLCREKDIPLHAKVVWKEEDKFGLSFLLDTQQEFENISYIINNRIT